MADTYRCALKNLPNQKHTCLQTYNFFLQIKNKQLMALVVELHDQLIKNNKNKNNNNHNT